MGFFHKPESDIGSNRRRLVSRAVLILIAALLFESIMDMPTAYEKYILPVIAAFTLITSLFFFGIIIIATLFQSDDTFRPNPHRLFADAVVSIIASIISFALCYRYFGVLPASADSISRFDYYYFSAVTFTTLGYGDFRPSPDSRFFAGLQAIIGNLHLGVIVGAAFYAAQPGLKHQAKSHAANDHGKRK